MKKYKEIKNYPDYIIYEDGSIYSFKSDKFLTPSYNNTSHYAIVKLTHKSKAKSFRVHRLVAEAFIPNSNPIFLTDIHHKDENKKNNHYTNLEWINHNIHSSIGKKKGPQGISCHLSKLTELDVKYIKYWLSKNFSGAILAEKFKVSRTVVYNIKNNKTWTHIQFP